MKRLISNLILLVVVSSVFFSCKNDKGARLETISGRAGEVFVVLGKETWKAKTGELIRGVLAQPQSSLPQAEPMFDLTNVPPEAFVNVFKKGRNILMIKISPTYTESKVEFSNDIWAYPQAVVSIQVKSTEDFESLFKENSEKIMSFFLKAEKDRLKTTYKNMPEKSVYKTLLDEFHIQLYAPNGFQIVKRDSTFAWIRYDTPQITQNIFVYTYPYDSDSTFTEKFQVGMRNVITRKNIPGPSAGSYMTTEMELPRDFNILKYNGNYASEMRGLWYVEHDFMGGPFISLSVLDAARKRIVTVEGNVYAPKDNKRNFLRQVEAIVYSLEFPKQKVNDKIIHQLESGN